MAALSAAGAATAHHMPRKYAPNNCFASSHSFPRRSSDAVKQRRVRMPQPVRRNSAEEDSAATATDEEVMEVPKGPPSLISALNVEKALRGIAITDADHYGTLGLQTGCSYDQVNAAYKDRVAQVMNQGLSEEELSKQLELLKESHSILSSVEERRLYDWSLARNGNPDRYAWPFEVDITQAPKGIPPPREPEDEGPTRLVGYFMLSWLILSFTLLIAFNR